jgi:tetratricopeptide (TPR) repeat protein
MTVETLIEIAWNEHGDRPQEVADRLAASLELLKVPQHIPPFARLLTHIFGEHLGQWHRGIDLLESLRGLPAFDGDGSIAGILNRNIATLRYAAGESTALDSLSAEDRVSAMAAAATAFAGRREFKRAIEAYTGALQLASTGFPSDSPAIRSLAVGGNNLAAALEEKKERDAHETAGMIAAALSGLQYWKLAGTWLEEERAEYRLTRSLLQAGDPDRAIQSAERCIDVCKRNNAPPFEQFFGYVALALAQRAAGSDSNRFEASRRRALDLFEEIPEAERHWCESDLRDIGG